MQAKIILRWDYFIDYIPIEGETNAAATAKYTTSFSVGGFFCIASGAALVFSVIVLAFYLGFDLFAEVFNYFYNYLITIYIYVFIYFIMHRLCFQH